MYYMYHYLNQSTARDFYTDIRSIQLPFKIMFCTMIHKVIWTSWVLLDTSFIEKLNTGFRRHSATIPVTTDSGVKEKQTALETLDTIEVWCPNQN